MKSANATWILGCLVLAVIGVCCLLYPRFGGANSPPRPVGEPLFQRVVAAHGNREVHATFRITNRGGRVLNIGEVKTTCGCSVATLEPKQLAGGESAIVQVAGTAPDAGEKTVLVNVATNSDVPVAFSLTMVGAASPPFVVLNSGPLRFGVIKSIPFQVPLIVRTNEKRETEPWIRSAETSVQDLTIAGGVEEEHDLGGGTVSRVYRFVAELTKTPPPGLLTGTVALMARDRKDSVLVVPVHGAVRRSVFAIPASLYSSFPVGSTHGKLVIKLMADESGFELHAKPAKSDLNAITIKQTGSGAGTVDFEIDVEARTIGTIATDLIFETNHHEMRIVRVPMLVKIVGGTGVGSGN